MEPRLVLRLTGRRRLLVFVPSRQKEGWSSAYSSSSHPDPGNNPIRVAICGAGPAGFYSAKQLFALDQQASLSRPLAIDLFEALPAPFGLSRYGVAPDHPEVKNCETKFEQVARHPRFRYFGNTTVLGEGQEQPSGPRASIRLTTLREEYDGVLLAYGAGEDRSLGGLPGEMTLGNILPARAAVDWYNEYPSMTRSLRKGFVDLSKVERVTIIGMGNVALDIARILLSNVDVLARTDMGDEVLGELARSRVKHVEIVGRRGPLQTAFTTRELRELVSLPDLSMDIDQSLLVDAASRIAEPGVLPRMTNGRLAKRLLDLMLKASSSPSLNTNTTRTCSLRFLRTPVAFHGSSLSPSPTSNTNPSGKVFSVDWSLNKLDYPLDRSLAIDYTTLKASPVLPQTIQRSSTDLVLKSLGSVPRLFPPLTYDPLKSRARNEQGKVIGADDQLIDGIWVTGWLSTGSKGVIGDTMMGAYQTASSLFDQLQSSVNSKPSTISPFQPSVLNHHFRVDWDAWTRIDLAERHLGQIAHKPRVKSSSVHQMLQLAGLL